MSDDHRCAQCDPRGRHARELDGGSFQRFSDDFTYNNDWDGTDGHDEDMLMYHAVFALSAGIPLCCLAWWIQKCQIEGDLNLAVKAGTGINPLTKQQFALCPKKTHEWPDWVKGELLSWKPEDVAGPEDVHDVWRCGCGVCTNWEAYADWFVSLGLIV